MARYFNGVDFDRMTDIQPGDTIWLASHEVFLVVIERMPPLRSRNMFGPVIQRSAIVEIGNGSEGLPDLPRQSAVMLMVNKETPDSALVTSF